MLPNHPRVSQLLFSPPHETRQSGPNSPAALGWALNVTPRPASVPLSAEAFTVLLLLHFFFSPADGTAMASGRALHRRLCLPHTHVTNPPTSCPPNHLLTLTTYLYLTRLACPRGIAVGGIDMPATMSPGIGALNGPRIRM